jgi:hypothetical protein
LRKPLIIRDIVSECIQTKNFDPMEALYEFVRVKEKSGLALLVHISFFFFNNNNNNNNSIFSSSPSNSFYSASLK